MDILNNLNMHGNEIQNAVAQNLIAAPVDPIQGLFYFDTNSKKLLYYNGKRWVYAGDDDTTYTFTEGEANGQIKVTDSGGGSVNVSVKGLAAAAYKNVDSSIPVGSASANVPTSAAVAAAISIAMATVDAMCYKGTLGQGGKYTALPTDDIKAGDTYRVITTGTYAGLSAKVGDLIIAEADTLEWGLVPSGDDGNAYKYTAANPALTASSDICTWTVTHGLGNKYPLVQIYEISTGEMILADIIAVSASQLKILINSTDDIAAGEYQAVIIG